MSLEDLYIAAETNLSASDLQEYHSYKKRLLIEGEPEESAEQILTGYIWDCIDTDNSEE